MTDLLVRLLIGILPVIAFLVVLIYLDSYKLIRPGWVLATIATGGLIAGLSYLVNISLLEGTGMELRTLARYVAPAIEEIGKAAIIIYLIRAHRIGFLVDAGIYGFAVGAGFAVVENVYYYQFLPDSHLAVWLVRGFGTAVMHGGTTAIFAIAARALSDRDKKANALMFVPGLLLAIVIHSGYNHFILTPVMSTIGILVVLPPLVFLVFSRSEKSLRDWLDVGFDADTSLLELIHSGELSRSRVGLYLQSLKERFPGELIVDMLCYMRLHVEFSLRAKGLLMMRESGFDVELGPELKAGFKELEYLDKSIGKTGKLAMAPFLHLSGKELWQLYMLGK